MRSTDHYFSLVELLVKKLTTLLRAKRGHSSTREVPPPPAPERDRGGSAIVVPKTSTR
jgi:hypothetical protein